MPFSSQPRSKKGTAQSGRKLDTVCGHSVPTSQCKVCGNPSTKNESTNPTNEKQKLTATLEKIRKVLDSNPKAAEKASKILTFWISKK